MMKINWKKGLFSFNYKLLSSNQEVGELIQSFFSNSSIGKLSNTKLKFKKKGIFSSETDILDLNLNQPIGKIKFDGLGSNAVIMINGKNYRWNYDNFWYTRWSISENEKGLINYKSSTTTGEIESSIDNELLILCGLFLYNYHAILTIIFISTLIVIIAFII